MPGTQPPNPPAASCVPKSACPHEFISPFCETYQIAGSGHVRAIWRSRMPAELMLNVREEGATAQFLQGPMRQFATGGLRVNASTLDGEAQHAATTDQPMASLPNTGPPGTHGSRGAPRTDLGSAWWEEVGTRHEAERYKSSLGRLRGVGSCPLNIRATCWALPEGRGKHGALDFDRPRIEARSVVPVGAQPVGVPVLN